MSASSRMGLLLAGGAIAVVTLAVACLPPSNSRNVYTIEKWTVNGMACDTEGPVQTTSTDHRFAVNLEPTETDGGAALVVAATCSYSNCIARTDRTDIDAWKMDQVTDSTFSRDVIVVDTATLTTCTGYVESRHLTLVNSASPRTFRMERKRRPFSLLTSCGDGNIAAAAAANACNYLEVLVGPYDRDEQEYSGGSFDDD